MSTCSRLYTILKSPDPLRIPSFPSTLSNSYVTPPKRSCKEDYGDQIWLCWECKESCENGKELVNHIKKCNPIQKSDGELFGCPFCPQNMNQPSEKPFSISVFNEHVREVHPTLKTLICSYCMKDLNSNRLEDLTSHVILTHKIPWRPSAVSLAHMRETQLPHRVVTCLGCGWCTFVLRANNAAQPPNSLETHMNRCAYSGGQVNLVRLDKEVCESPLEKFKALQEAELISTNFAQSFPLVRGYSKNPQAPISPLRFHRYIRGTPSSPSNVDEKQSNVPSDEVTTKTTPLSSLKTKPKKQSNKTGIQPSKLPKDVDNSAIKTETIFDIPLTLPPPPPARPGYKKQAPTRLFVCPLCGDNALASLRERDEHLQSSHNGELVFPCQICGMAYPFYIALRRHAALQHDSDFDTVRYGPPELGESEPIECPECQLVAFHDPLVLKLHVSRIHKKTLSPLNQSSKGNTKKENESILSKYSQNSLDVEVHQSENKSELKKTLPTQRNRNANCRSRGRQRNSKNKSKFNLNESTEIHASCDHIRSSIINNSNSNIQIFPSTSSLERMLCKIDGSHAPVCCSLCRLELDNPKELNLHLELEHSSSHGELKQLGCQACGRVFFGSGGRIDLIGHLRVLHQDDIVLNALKCSHADKCAPESNSSYLENTDPLQHVSAVRHCDALFASPRLRQIHMAVSSVTNPGFACPFKFDFPDSSLPELVRLAILTTEILADNEGLMILAYCCPNCSRLFAGQDADSRFIVHRNDCANENNPSESIQPPESISTNSNVDSADTHDLQC